VVTRLRGRLARWFNRREIEETLRLYHERTGADADRRSAFADAGSFRSQVERLFEISLPTDPGELREIAPRTVSLCFANRYYKPADCLADVVDALETWTFLSHEPEGEPGIDSLEGPARVAKLRVVIDSWLVPAKVAAIETLLGCYADAIGRSLPYTALARFERQAARLLALLEQPELLLVGERLAALVEGWPGDATLKQRFREPADALRQAVDCLEGISPPADPGGLRVRVTGQPLRLSTVLPEQRTELIRVALSALTGPPPEEKPPSPEPLVAAAPVAVAAEAPFPEPSEPDLAEGQAAAEGRVSIALECPKCGATCTIDDETVTVPCEYCGSLLIVEAPDRDEVYYEPGRVRDGGEILELVIAYRKSAQRAEIIARYTGGDREREPVAEWLVRQEMDAFEKRLRAQSRLLEVHRFLAPYWQISGLLLQGALGRFRDGPKVLRVRGYGVEHTVPGYDVLRANLRDRGLRLGRARLRPLTLRKVAELGAFLPWGEVGDRSYHELDKWRTRTLEPGFDPILKHGELQLSRKLLVYRSYWLARVEADRGPEWVLVDGAFATVAGYPTASEVNEILAQRVRQPLDAESHRRVTSVASRCPDCGFEQRLDRRHFVSVCTNCHLALEPGSGGIRILRYDHVPGEDRPGTEFLPFWRYRVRLRIGDSPFLEDLQSYAAALFPDGTPPGFSITGPHLWVPAFRLLGSVPGDEALKRLCEWIHAAPPDVTGGKIPVDQEARAWGASVPEAEARRLARAVLLAVHNPASAARLNALLLRQRVLDTEVEVSEPRLVMVPFVLEDKSLSVEGLTPGVPRLLLEGGPELDALRLSVHTLASRA
jgi:hypothetical protein